MNQIISPVRILIITCLIIAGCKQTSAPISVNYQYIEPTYDNIELQPQGDSLHFLLDTNSYNQIKTFNYFLHKGKPYIAFFDKIAKCLNFYDFNTQRFVDRIRLKNKFANGYIYVENFDSIFIINEKRLFLLDSSEKRKDSIDLFDGLNLKAIVDNETPAVLSSNVLYTGVQAVSIESSLKEQQQWNVICGFDMANHTKKLYYQLPALYRENRYGHSFLEYSYCVNDRGNFVFSFPADTNIYETNLVGLNNAYYGKSRFQSGVIAPVAQSTIDSGQSRREYYLRDGYGTIYYDPFQKRYLRFAKQKITEANILANKKERKRSVIIFNENFKIIGESAVADSLGFKTIFITPKGSIYIRTNAADEQALHFVRLDYSDKHQPEQLTQHKPILHP